jgi:hypothetical protein
MSRKFQDENLLVWEAYPSAGRFGFSAKPNLIFNCLTDRLIRPRSIRLGEDNAEAERALVDATPHQLVAWLQTSSEIS